MPSGSLSPSRPPTRRIAGRLQKQQPVAAQETPEQRSERRFIEMVDDDSLWISR